MYAIEVGAHPSRCSAIVKSSYGLWAMSPVRINSAAGSDQDLFTAADLDENQASH